MLLKKRLNFLYSDIYLPSGLLAVVKRTSRLSNASGKSGKYFVPSSARSTLIGGNKIIPMTEKK
jgi:hypothetical protein